MIINIVLVDQNIVCKMEIFVNFALRGLNKCKIFRLTKRPMWCVMLGLVIGSQIFLLTKWPIALFQENRRATINRFYSTYIYVNTVIMSSLSFHVFSCCKKQNTLISMCSSLPVVTTLWKSFISLPNSFFIVN